MKSTIFSLKIILFSILLFTSCTKEEIISPINTAAPTEPTATKGSNNPATVRDFENYINREIRTQKIPALSVLVFEEDQVLYEGLFGKSHIQKNRSLQKNDVFLLASVSKVITATALMQLYEKGRFSLDDNINKYLKFDVNNPYYSTPITFRMLLTHTAAIADGPAMDDQYYYGEDSPVGLGDFLENYLSPTGRYYDRRNNFHRSRPGKNYEYSNIGNALIGLLVEQISGIDFNDYCKLHIFNPLGMNHTAWHLSDINQFIVQPYEYKQGRYQELEHYTFTDYPNGGLRSTTRDLFKFLQAFVQDGKSQQYQLLKASTVKAMTTFQIPTISDDMGLHLFQLDRQDNLWGHDGGEQGVSTIMAFSPDTKIGAIILTNIEDVDLEDLLIESYLMGFEL